MIARTLDDFGIIHGTDKNSDFHDYLKYYGFFFEPIRYQELNIMEIGIWEGGSLKTWRDYFCHSLIFGIDYEDKSQYDGDGIKTYIGDQNDVAGLVNIVKGMPELDIIIDDASHRSPHMISSFEALFPLLKSGGYYIIEDCLTGYNTDFCKQGELSIIDYLRKIVGDVHMNGKIVDLSSNRQKAVEKYEGNYFEKNIEWLFTSCGTAIIKKL